MAASVFGVIPGETVELLPFEHPIINATINNPGNMKNVRIEITS